MNRIFSALNSTETAASAVAASVLSVATLGVVLAAFANVSPVASERDVLVLERVTISAPRHAA